MLLSFYISKYLQYKNIKKKTKSVCVVDLLMHTGARPLETTPDMHSQTPFAPFYIKHIARECLLLILH